MKIKWIAFAIVTLLTITTIFLIPRIQRKIPEVPGNSTHVKVVNISECISCHINADTGTMPSDHAARDKCLFCHKIQENSH